MQRKYTMSFHVAGSASPSQIIAWISTPIAAIDATDAAMVCM